MTRLTKEHRTLIVREMMRKTHFKARFAAELQRLGVTLRAAYVTWLEGQYGKDLIDYIARMKPEFRRTLCHEVNSANATRATRSRLDTAAKNLSLMAGDKFSPGYEDAQFFLPGMNGPYVLVVKFSEPVWTPDVYKDFYFANLDDAQQILALLDAIADEFTTTVASLRGFLDTTTTLAKLKELMPEAAALIPEASHPIALIPNPGNAMAALTRAGYFDHAQEVAHA